MWLMELDSYDVRTKSSYVEVEAVVEVVDPQDTVEMVFSNRQDRIISSVLLMMKSVMSVEEMVSSEDSVHRPVSSHPLRPIQERIRSQISG